MEFSEAAKSDQEVARLESTNAQTMLLVEQLRKQNLELELIAKPRAFSASQMIRGFGSLKKYKGTSLAMVVEHSNTEIPIFAQNLKDLLTAAGWKAQIAGNLWPEGKPHVGVIIGILEMSNAAPATALRDFLTSCDLKSNVELLKTSDLYPEGEKFDMSAVIGGRQ